MSNKVGKIRKVSSLFAAVMGLCGGNSGTASASSSESQQTMPPFTIGENFQETLSPEQVKLDEFPSLGTPDFNSDSLKTGLVSCGLSPEFVDSFRDAWKKYEVCKSEKFKAQLNDVDNSYTKKMFDEKDALINVEKIVKDACVSIRKSDDSRDICEKLDTYVKHLENCIYDCEKFLRRQSNSPSARNEISMHIDSYNSNPMIEKWEKYSPENKNTFHDLIITLGEAKMAAKLGKAVLAGLSAENGTIEFSDDCEVINSDAVHKYLGASDRFFASYEKSFMDAQSKKSSMQMDRVIED